MKYKKVMIIIGLSILTLSAGIAYSVFHSEAKIKINDQNIAKFLFETKEVNNIELPIIGLKPGDKNNYLFKISNNESGKKSDVNIEYQIIIKTYHFIPFTIKLFRVDTEDVFIFECDETFSRNEQNELICNSPVQTINYSSEENRNYKLEVEFAAHYNQLIYSDLVDYINLEIKSWQKTGN